MFNKSNTIEQDGHDNIAIQNSNFYLTVSVFDEIKKYSEKGDYYKVADLINQVKNFAGIQHPYYPHYRYKPIDFGGTTVLDHEPLTPQAEKELPLSYKGKFSIPKEQLNGYNNLNELLDDAYFNQDEIEINMSSFNAWIGNNLVDTPNFDKILKDGKWVIAPEPLPVPLKLKFYIKDNPESTILDYLEMNISRKEGKDFIIIDNSIQEKSKLLVSLKIPISKGQDIDSKQIKLDVKIKRGYESDIKANYELLGSFKKLSSENKTVALKNLIEENDFLVVTSFKFTSNVVNLERDYKFINRLLKLEEHYKVTFSLPESITQDDMKIIDILESGIENKPIKGKLKNLTLNINSKQTVKNIIELFKSKEQKMTGEQSGPEGRIELFGATIPIKKIKTTYQSLKIEDLERLKGKLEYMDDGEKIKVIFIPGSNPEILEEYYFR